MQQFDQNKVNLETKLGEILPITKGSNKENITFKELLSHNAQLKAWTPFYIKTLDNNKRPLEKYYSKTLDNNYLQKVADSLFIRNDYHDTIIKEIISSKLNDIKEYKYSDFTFILLKEYLEFSTQKKLQNLSQDNFFSKIGMNNTLYNPLEKFDKSQIAPTEIDNYFRYSKIQGTVHDMAAAMEGGVAGHAGIFSNTIDLAKIMQMYLQKGNYGDTQFFSPTTFDAFNTTYYYAEGSRRGLGFDKTQLGKDGPTCGCVSKSSFGHTGFTGNIAWADPETQIVYIFLSNRTFPDGNAPNKLEKENIRQDIQQIIQDAIIK